jgi:hypothetical protein
MDSDVLFADYGDGTMALTKGPVRVAWTRLGEGWCGDYDPDDPDDEELLRFDVYLRDEAGEYQPVRGASYCTRFPVEADGQLKHLALRLILGLVYEPLVSGYPIAHLCEQLSWITPGWVLDQVQDCLSGGDNHESAQSGTQMLS